VRPENRYAHLLNQNCQSDPQGSPGQALVPAASRRARLSWCGSLFHEIAEPQIPPRGLPAALGRLLNAKRGVLVRHHVVLILWVDGLVMRRDVDLVVGQLVLAKVLKQVRVPRPLHVYICITPVLVLSPAILKVSIDCQARKHQSTWVRNLNKRILTIAA
jgi:hypothetical protein